MFSNHLYFFSQEIPLGVVRKSFFRKGHGQIGGGYGAWCEREEW